MTLEPFIMEYKRLKRVLIVLKVRELLVQRVKPFGAVLYFNHLSVT